MSNKGNVILMPSFKDLYLKKKKERNVSSSLYREKLGCVKLCPMVN